MTRILVFDPGDHTGWVYRDDTGRVVGGTCGKDHMEVAERILVTVPQLVVFESFNLYPNMAKSLAWNSFYPCEVIGVIRYLCDRERIPYLVQAPSVKKYSGLTKQSPLWLRVKKNIPGATEHTWDAFQHLRYYELNHERT